MTASALEDANNHDHYPLSAEDLLNLIEAPFTEKGWIPPLGNKPVRLVNVYVGSKRAYELFDQGKTFTASVPVYGAGRDNLEERYLNMGYWPLGLKNREYYQLTRSFNPMLSQGFFY